MKEHTLTHTSHKPYLIIGMLATLTIAVIFVAIAYFSRPPTVAVSGNQQTKGEVATNKSTSSTTANGSSISQPGDDKSDTGGGTSSTLIAPSGNFVSNHHPNLSGSPAPNVISSVCTTTPGASCRIIFTKDTVVKSLPAQTTDRGGSTYWSWKLQDVGLSAGTWKVEATSSLAGQSQSTADALNLEVAQ